MNKPVVSIIVPCYNHAQYLSESLQSVLEQTYVNWECIIVNDGSPDNTKEIASLWMAKDKRFKYIEKENGGLSSARNVGITGSLGEYILPLDADDCIHNEFLTKLVPELVQDDSLAIVSCYSKFFINSISNIIYEFKPLGTTYRDLLYENNMIATSLFRKKCWEEVGGYDENMKNGFEDWDFWLSITKRGWKYKFIEDFLFYYRKAKRSMLVETLEYYRESNMEYMYIKHKEIYIEYFENTMMHLFFLIKRHRDSEVLIKKSLEYKIAKIICKPFRVLQKLKLIKLK